MLCVRQDSDLFVKLSRRPKEQHGLILDPDPGLAVLSHASR